MREDQADLGITVREWDEIFRKIARVAAVGEHDCLKIRREGKYFIPILPYFIQMALWMELYATAPGVPQEILHLPVRFLHARIQHSSKSDVVVFFGRLSGIVVRPKGMPAVRHERRDGRDHGQAYAGSLRPPGGPRRSRPRAGGSGGRPGHHRRRRFRMGMYIDCFHEVGWGPGSGFLAVGGKQILFCGPPAVEFVDVQAFACLKLLFAEALIRR